MHDVTARDLALEWEHMLARHTTHPAARDVGLSLLDSWTEPHRRYHSLRHLRDILTRVAELADWADDPDAVRIAAWYHDAVYDGLPDDEERSARRAEEELSHLAVAPHVVDEVARLVRMTMAHDPAPGDHNGEVLSDADLSTLALPPAEYRSNTEAIRAEYAHVPDEVVRKGRMQVLTALLDGPAVFRTSAGRQRWESAARVNMRAELAELSR